MAAPVKIFAETFRVKDVDKDGVFFDRVSRIECKLESALNNDDVSLELDINTDLFKVDVNDSLHFQLVFNTEDTEMFSTCNYCMHGKVYKLQEHDKKLYVAISFNPNNDAELFSFLLEAF